MRFYHTQPNEPTPLDDLPAGRLADAMALMFYMRRLGIRWMTVAPGSPSHAVSRDLAATGLATIRPDRECHFPGAQRVELVRREVR